jgi:type I restriction enzyme, S subunit
MGSVEAKLPKLRFSNFIDSWKANNFDDIYSFHPTNSLSRENLNYLEGAVKNIHYGDIHKKFSTIFKVEEEEVPYINSDISLKNVKLETYCKEGDLAIADASEDYADIGKSIEINSLSGEKVLCGLHTFLARPLLNTMANGFAGYLMQTWSIRKQLMIIAQGTKVLSISTGRLGKIRLYIPYPPEQQKIASFLTAVDDKIQQLQRKKELLEQYKKGVMQKIFKQEIRFKDDDGKEFPKWEIKSLNKVISDFIVPMRDKPKELNGYIPWCRIEDFEGKYLSGSKSKQGVSIETVKKMNLKIYPVNTLLVSCSANLGFCAIVKNELITNQTFIGLVPIFDKIDVNFLYYIMKLSSRKLNILSSGTTISYLSRNQFEKFKINLPCLCEQQKIADFLTSIDKKIELVNTQLEKTQIFKKGLLQQMFV